MKKSTWLTLAALALAPTLSHAKTEYFFKQSNNPANYVKADREAPGNFQHPYRFEEENLKNILRSLRYNRAALVGEKVKERSVFEEEYVQQYAPILAKAFAAATPEQAVVLSVVQKRPLLIIRNDSLTQAKLWVVGDELHFRFLKTEAKLSGDYQARTTGTKLIGNARGLRITLDPQPGQKFAADSTEEIILDLKKDWSQVVAQIDAEDQALEDEKAAKKSRVKAAPASVEMPKKSAKDQKNAEQRLTELKRLKEQGLIEVRDYERKKEEILQGL